MELRNYLLVGLGNLSGLPRNNGEGNTHEQIAGNRCIGA
jgi:hypothetical protein